MITFKGVAVKLSEVLNHIDYQDLSDICYDGNIKAHPAATKDKLIQLIIDKVYS
jgi:hypothetical protein